LIKIRSNSCFFRRKSAIRPHRRVRTQCQNRGGVTPIACYEVNLEQLPPRQVFCRIPQPTTKQMSLSTNVEVDKAYIITDNR